MKRRVDTGESLVADLQAESDRHIAVVNDIDERAATRQGVVFDRIAALEQESQVLANVRNRIAS